MEIDACAFLRKGEDEDRFIITRAQARRLADFSYDLGKNGATVRTITFHCVKKFDPDDSQGAEEVARTKWLHMVTARHLRKARMTIRELRGSVDRLQGLCREKDDLIYAYRGSIGNVRPSAPVPEHYLGDGYVTCDRAIESASAQRCNVNRPPLNYWYWATAFKYVWRMWSKTDPVSDARKAIDCLEKAAGICRAVELDGSDPCGKGDGFNIVSPAAWPLRVKAVDCLRKCSKEVRRG